MRNFQKKGKFKRMTQSKSFLVFFGILILFFIYSLFGFVVKMQETIKNREVSESKINELEKRKEKLITDINKLRTDQGVEENIREKFGLAKEGENMIMIIDDKTPQKEEVKSGSSDIFSVIKNWFK